MIIEDVTGKSLTAMKVFAKSIEALMQHLFDIFYQRGKDIQKTDIRWVLTVPAIWSDAAKQFMRKSAELVSAVFLVDIVHNTTINKQCFFLPKIKPLRCC